MPEISTAFPRFSKVSLRAALEELREIGFAHLDSEPPPALGPWAELGPAAMFLHFATKDVPYKSAREISAFLRTRLRGGEAPSPSKSRMGVELALPRHRLPGTSFWKVLHERRTWRRFSREPVALGHLSTLLHHTFGVKQWIDVGSLGRAALKTSPSGGACHPLEAYVAVRNVAAVKPGLYHYAPERHVLECLRTGLSWRHLAAYFPNQPWFHRPAFVVFMTAVLERAAWHYPHSRTYRAISLEAGHFCQTLSLVATALGLAPFQTVALADSRIERDLGIDGINEPVLYAAGFGLPPGDGLDPAYASQLQRYGF